MKIYLMTDMEGVAGMINFEDWCMPESRYYEMGKEFLTLEVNAAVDGFFLGGATGITVADGHGHGAINPQLLDPRTELMRGWPSRFPFLLDDSYDAVVWIGQHAKSGTEYAHLAHTQSFLYLDESINGTSIGEFGQVVLCASELGVRAIFGAGDEAFAKEAGELVPGIETVAVKRGTTPGRGDECDAGQYEHRNTSAIHLHPEVARDRIREGARRAIERAAREDFGLIDVQAPFERVTRFRADGEAPPTISRQTHPASIIALMNVPYDPRPESP